MSTAPTTWVMPKDEKAVTYIQLRLAELAEMNMKAGQHLDEARRFVEDSVRIQQELKSILRDGAMQLQLPLTL